MAKNPNISLSVSTSKAQQEVKALTDNLKTVKKEFEIANLSIQASGTQLDVLTHKIQGYSKQAEAQKAITSRISEVVSQATAAYQAAGQKVESARAAYDRAAKSENASKEEIQKLKNELDKANNTYEKLGKQVSQWNDKLLSSRKAEAQLSLAVKQTTAEVEKHNKSLSENVKKTQNVTTASGQLLNVYSLIKGLALGYAGKTLFDALIGGNAQFEQYMASFEVLLGGADKAQKRMDELTVFAAKTPFELPQVVEAEKRLLAYGVAAEDTAEVMQILGDISMGNAEKLNMISLAYGQVVTNAKLYGTELRQFAENGVPLLAALAEMYGKTESEMRKMIEGGQISSQAVTEALRRMTAEGGKFYGMMEKQSQTMEGLWATLKDNVGMFAREVGEDSFNYLKDELTSFMDTLNQMAESGELNEIASEMGRNIAKFTEFVVDAVKILWELKDVLIAVGSAMAITSIINAAVQAFNALRATVLAVKAGFDAAKASNDVLNASLIKSPWGLVAVAIGLVGGALVTYALNAGIAQTETDKLVASTQELTEEYERNIKAADRQTNATLGQVTISEKLAKELENLSTKTNKTTAEKDRMKQLVDQLNNNIPNLVLAINSETGELNKQIGVVYNAIEAYKELIFVKASEKRASAAAESILGFQEQKTALEKQLGELQKVNNQYQKEIDRTNSANPYVRYDFADNNKQIQQVKESIASIDQAMSDANKQIDESIKKSQEYAQKYGNQKTSNEQKVSTPPPLLPSTSKKTSKSAEDAIKKEFSDLKYYLDMEYITEAEYYKRLAALRDKYYKAGSTEYQQYTLEIKKYNDKLKEDAIEAEKDKFDARRANSDRWINEQKFYGQLSVEQEIKAYEAIRKYVKEYYDKGIIDNKEYLAQIRQLNQNEFTVRKKALEDEISKTIEAQKKILDARKESIEDEAEADKKRFDARKKAIEEEYELIERQEKQADRSEQLSELQSKEEIYQHAATKEGKERLKAIREEIEKLNKEAAKEERDIEKNNRLDALEQEQVQAEENRKRRLEEISKEYENLEQTQKNLLDSITDYASAAAGTLEEVTAKVRALIEAVNQATSTAAQATQTVNNKNVTINQTNKNYITDPVSANILGQSLNSGLSRIS